MAQYRGAQLIDDPPTQHFPQLTKHIDISIAQSLVADYLERAKSDISLHPDSWLTTSGIQYGPDGGPNGGLTLHYLRRVEAGLRGESLTIESKADLAGHYIEDEATVGEAMDTEEGADAAVVPTRANGTQLPESNDARLDAVIGANATSRKKEKTQRKRKREEDVHTAPEESSLARDPDIQPKTDFEQSQKELTGEVGDRLPAENSGAPPVVVEHDADGHVKEPNKPKTDADRAARKAAKAAKRKERKKAQGTA